RFEPRTIPPLSILSQYTILNHFLEGEIDYDALYNTCGEIIRKCSDNKLGMTIPMGKLFAQLIANVSESSNDSKFQEGCEAIFLTMEMIASHIHIDLLKSTEARKAYNAITQSIEENKRVERQIIEKFDQHIRNLFQVALDRARANGTQSLPYILLEASILKYWSNITPSIDSNKSKNFIIEWDNGIYPLRFTNESLYEFIRAKIDNWVNIALEKLSSRFLNKLLGILLVIAEGGQDFEFVKEVTLKSLELTENLVTEATPNDVPACLAAFYERQENCTKALHYYNLALDGIKSAIPPLWQDVIIYRAALLTSESGAENATQEALKIIGRFHPDFHGKTGYIRMPAIKHCAKLAEDLAHKLEYKNAQAAIKDLIG
ncbi:MAG: hypothetical protein ACFFBD_21805, partial [Candidatus Hodarchaeota archaeon]